MKNIGWFSGFSIQPSPAGILRAMSATAAVLLLAAAGSALAQDTTPSLPTTASQMSIPNGYTAHSSIDIGGRVTNTVGSGAMYNTLVNLQSGPRVLGQTFELHAQPGNKHSIVDDLSAFSTGFGGEPYNFAKLDATKGNDYEFSGVFRRDRQYFDYNLLGNPNIPFGQTMPISGTATGTILYPQVLDSPFLFNTVRRMTDTNLTIHPLSTITYRFGYSQNIMQGPSRTPSGYQVAGSYSFLLQEYQRNSSDDFFGAIDWKPAPSTKLSFETQIDHYKGDSYFTLDPTYLAYQLANGTPVALAINYDSLSPFTAGSCNTAALGTGSVFSAPVIGNLPVLNSACSMVTSYSRTQPTRALLPTGIFRLQSTAIKNVTMNGNVRYTQANTNLPVYTDIFNGLVTSNSKSTATRSVDFIGNANAEREVIAADYGISWQLAPQFGLSDEISYSNQHQPGTANIPTSTTVTTAAGTPQTIDSTQLTSTPAAANTSVIEGSPYVNQPLPGFFGQSFLTNNLTGTWDVTARTILSLTYRYSTHTIALGFPHNVPLPVAASGGGSCSGSATGVPTCTGGTVQINENGGILNAALHPAKDWDLNGTVEIAYADNAFTPVAPRQLKRYRLHTIYRPAGWLTVNASYSDVERHNNTNNNQAAVAAGVDPYIAPIDHVDYSRIGSVGAVISKSEHYAFDFNYSYNDVYTATNICFDNGNQGSTLGTYPGTATLTATGAPNVCPGVFERGSTTQLATWFGRDFMHAPTQFGYAALMLTPNKTVKSDIGYTVTAVNGSRFFTDARDVNGTMVSTFQSPYVDVSYAMRPSLVWKAQYNFYGYGEGGPSGPQLCSLSTSPTSTVSPCTSFASLGVTGVTGLTGPAYGQTAPRNFHANNILLGVHYEF
jgi:hypothetical protein